MRPTPMRPKAISDRRRALDADTIEGWLPSFTERLAARAHAAEKLGRLPDETVAEAADAGFFWTLAPKRFGGDEYDFRTFLDAVRRMAHGCTSSAWTLSFLALHVWILSKFDPALQEELFAKGAPPMAPAPLAPTGTARPVDGGYMVSGRWEWATGVRHGDWIMINGIEPGAFSPRFCVMPIADVTVEDNWHVAGMCATGSNAVRAKDVFVPAHRTVEALRLRAGETPGGAIHDYPELAYPFGPTLALVAATPALGAAEGALAAFGARMKEKIQAYSGGVKQGDLPTTHLRMGEALAAVRAARLVWLDAITELEHIGPMGAAAPVSSLAKIRLASADIVRLANVAVNGLANAAGASSGYLNSPIQRALRDLQMMRGHVVFDWDRAAQIGGKIELGGEPSPADML